MEATILVLTSQSNHPVHGLGLGFFQLKVLYIQFVYATDQYPCTLKGRLTLFIELKFFASSSVTDCPVVLKPGHHAERAVGHFAESPLNAECQIGLPILGVMAFPVRLTQSPFLSHGYFVENPVAAVFLKMYVLTPAPKESP